MARTRVYIKPFKSDGTYGEWLEATRDVVAGSLGSIQRKLDISEFDIGVYTNSAVAIGLRNDHGKYSSIESGYSIFRFRRADSLVKVTWDLADWDFFVGISEVGEIQGGEAIIYEGLLNDDGASLQIKNHRLSFTILGYESLFDRTLCPDWVANPPADNLVSTLIKAVVESVNAQLQAAVLTVDLARILPSNDVTWDDLSTFTNKTNKEALKDLLMAANSILFMESATPVVSGRTPSAEVLHEFFGPGSVLGPENICDISDIRSGLNRTFNFVRWEAANLVSTDDTSIAAHGVRKKDVNLAGVTTTLTRTSIIDAVRSEFGSPLREFKLVTPLNYDVLSLPLLFRASIDFPLVPVNAEILALYGVAEYGVDKYPIELSTFEIPPTEHYKAIGMEINSGKNTASFHLRRVS